MTEIEPESTKFQDAALAPMHTVEHLLNGAVSRKLGIPRAYTTHIEKKKSKIDLKYTRNLTPEEVVALETEVNDAIRSGCSVTEELIDYAVAEECYDVSRIPESGRTGNIRIVRIGSFDACPCIGTHVASTAACGGLLKIISSDFTPETETLRIRFKIVK